MIDNDEYLGHQIDEEMIFWKKANEMLSIWTVYNDPLDYPGKIVARRFEVDASGSRPTESVIIVSNLNMMWEIMINQLHLTRLPREEGDDPKIVECWL